MNFRLVFKLTGKTLLVEAGALLLPLLVCLFYRENPLPFLLSIAMTGAVGLALSLIRSNDHFFPREGFFAVALILGVLVIVDYITNIFQAVTSFGDYWETAL